MQGRTIKRQLYESIRKDIMDGVYDSNTVLNEKALVEQYNVSKSPVREALVLLCNEGFLKSMPRFGYMLTTFTPSEILEITEYRKIIELNALEISFPHIKSGDLAELKKLNNDLINIVDTQSPKTHWDSNMTFHIKLCGYCGNKYLIKSLADSLNICTIISNQYFTKLWDESKRTDGENHIELVNAIEARDLKKSKQILYNDVEAFKKEFI